jgi:hypothetical protein
MDEHLTRSRLGVGRVLVAQNLRPPVLVYANCLHNREKCSALSAELVSCLASLAQMG